MTKLPFLLIALFLLLGCGGDDRREEDPTRIRGVVTDAAGQPVLDAKILFHYNWDSLPAGAEPEVGSLLTQDSLQVQFDLSQPGLTRLWVEDWILRQPLATLLNATLPAGSQTVGWDLRGNDALVVPNGAYWFLLSSSSVLDSFSVFLNVDAFARGWSAYAPAATSGSDGRFERTQTGLPFELRLTDTSTTPPWATVAVSREIDVIALRPDGTVARVDDVFVDPYAGAFVELQFAN